MKKKYYMRGVGMGVLITTIILGISYNRRMSDENVISKAKKLGMVFETEIPAAEPTLEPDENGGESNEDGNMENEESVEPENGAQGNLNEPINEGETAPAETAPETLGERSDEGSIKASENVPATEKNTKDSKVTITITKGMWSNQVSKLLKEKGLIQDAEKFDDYLVDSGYSMRIRMGKFQIPYGASYKEIANIIATK